MMPDHRGLVSWNNLLTDIPQTGVRSEPSCLHSVLYARQSLCPYTLTDRSSNVRAVLCQKLLIIRHQDAILLWVRSNAWQLNALRRLLIKRRSQFRDQPKDIGEQWGSRDLGTVQRDKGAAVQFLLRGHGFVPTAIVTDKLRQFTTSSTFNSFNQPTDASTVRECGA
jgi:hypothetical protein